jgi:hypothetical protein
MLVNLIEIPTAHGWRTIELREGSILTPDVEARPDILVVSSFRDSYNPVPGTVIGSLHRELGVSVRDLARNPEFQIGLHDAWMTPPLPGNLPFQRIVCVEMLQLREQGGQTEETIKRAVRSLFGLLAVAEINGVDAKRIAMPMLGTGNQGLSRETVLPWIIETVSKLLSNLSSVSTVQLYVLNEGAKVSEMLNAYLDRGLSAAVGLSEEGKAVAARVCTKLHRLLDRPSGKVDGSAARELLTQLRSDAASFLPLAVFSRRLVEALAQNIAASNGAEVKGELIRQIEGLSAHGVTPWMLSYMHLIRTFGNTATHGNPKESRPKSVTQSDLFVLLSALDRVLGWSLEEEALR